LQLGSILRSPASWVQVTRRTSPSSTFTGVASGRMAWSSKLYTGMFVFPLAANKL
jgi:hypothetical protein